MPQFEPIIDVTLLDGPDGFRIDGRDEFDQLGYGLSGGDVDGDGLSDLIIGASGGDPTTFGRDGEVWVVLGAGSGFSATLDLASIDGSNGFKIIPRNYDNSNGNTGDNTGTWLDTGDVNGDGIADILIRSQGEAHVVYGDATGFGPVVDLAALTSSTGLRIEGLSTNGADMAAADFNGDGYDDVLLGQGMADPYSAADPGRAFIVFGGPAGGAGVVSVSSLDGSNGFTFVGIDGEDFTGGFVSGADVNGDARDDLLVSAPLADQGAELSTGETYVLLGQASVGGATISAGMLNGSNGYQFDGSAASEGPGSVRGLGDVNADGFEDFAIGAMGASPGGRSAAGEAYVVFGQAAGFVDPLVPSALDGGNGFAVEGLVTGAELGAVVAPAGDVNGDGFDDVLLVAQGTIFSPATPATNGVYVIFGKTDGFDANFDLAALNGDNGFKLSGIPLFDGEGIGDFNGDGFDDIAASYAGNTTGSKTQNGSTFVVLADRPTDSVTRTGTAIDNTINGGRGIDIVSGLGGNDTLRGWEGGDTLDGGVGIDTIDYSRDSVAGGGAAVSVYLSSNIAIDGFGATDTLISIENVTGTDVSSAAYNDVVLGTTVANVIDLRAGGDIAVADGGADVLLGGIGTDALYGGDGDDTLVGGDFTSAFNGEIDYLFGDAGNDVIYTGTRGTAYIEGGTGNDVIVGGSGTDYVISGAGSDYVVLGGGVDLAIIYAPELIAGDVDTYADFTDGQDFIFMSASLAATTAFGDGAGFAYMAVSVAGGTHYTFFSGATTAQVSDQVYFNL